jgi:Fe-S cluster biogenesis protein NfuA
MSAASPLQRIEALVQTLEAATDAPTRAAARELTQALLDLHRVGLERLVGLIDAAALTAACGDDTVLHHLLLLHGLHPVAVETRVRRALERVRPGLRAHGVEVEVMVVTGGTVRLRLLGDGAGGLLPSLRRGVEATVLEAAPDLERVEIDGPAQSPLAWTDGRVPLPLVR